MKEPIQTGSIQLLRTHSLCVHVYLSIKERIKTDGGAAGDHKNKQFLFVCKMNQRTFSILDGCVRCVSLEEE